MKVRKFTLTQANSSASVYKVPESMNDIFEEPKKDSEISIYLVEIKTTINPSDLVLRIGTDEQTRFLPLSLFKTKMIFFEGTYCLDTKGIDQFKFPRLSFKIEICNPDEDLSIDFFYSTDHESKYCYSPSQVGAYS